jgi:hypothetical protein
MVVQAQRRPKRKLNAKMKTRIITRRIKAKTATQYDSVGAAFSNQIVQTNSEPVMKMKGSERIATFLIDNTAVGQIQQIDIAPQNILGTRIAVLADTYQKYRFTKLRFRMAPGVSTSVSGTYTAGFSNEVDWNPTDPADIFVVKGARTATLWQTVEIDGDVKQRRQNWFMTSVDSQERQDTVQGVLAFTIEGLANLTGTLSAPMTMDYEIEFYGPRHPSKKDQTIYTNSDEQILSARDDTGQWNVQTGALPWEPTQPPYNVPLYIEPTIEFNVIEGTATVQKFANHMRNFRPPGSTWIYAFYESRQDCIDDIRIVTTDYLTQPKISIPDLVAYPL